LNFSQLSTAEQDESLPLQIISVNPANPLESWFCVTCLTEN
jgi:hypothetical protein